MKTIFTFIILAVLSIKGYSQSASFDNTFGNNGILLIPSSNSSEINVFDFDQNGNIYTAAWTSQGSGTGIYKLTVSKTDQNGVLDNQFGINGIATITIDYSEYPLEIKVLNNSKILISGSAYTGPTPNGPGPHIGFLVRLKSNGVIDDSFANNGVFKLQNDGSGFNSINILSDNSIILSGNINYQAALLKLSENGILDNQFGVNGIKSLSSTNFNFGLWKSILTDDNELISVGYMSNVEIAYCKTDTQGNFITTFGTNGKVILNLYSGGQYLDELIVKSITIKKGANNQYYLGGNYTPSSSIIIRINENGSLDQSFASSGILTYSSPFTDFDIQDDGKILIGETKGISPYNSGYSIVRFDNNGAIDNTLNNGGSFDIDISSHDDYLQSMKFRSPNSLFIGGSSYDNNVTKSTVIKLVLGNTLNVNDINEPFDFTLYPNPFTNQINIGGIDNIKTLRIYDLTGKPINFQVMNNTLYIIENITNGIYFLKIELENGKQITKKLIKE